jgi:hypothetical protein
MYFMVPKSYSQDKKQFAIHLLITFIIQCTTRNTYK